jgi:hypothetical protein
MPAEYTTSLAVRAYFAYGDPIFHVMDKKRCDALVNRVYHSSTSATANDICELFAIAAAGCHVNQIEPPGSSMSNFIQHCSVRLFQEQANNDTQLMRCYLGLSLCWDPARSPVARDLLGMSLNTYSGLIYESVNSVRATPSTPVIPRITPYTAPPTGGLDELGESFSNIELLLLVCKPHHTDDLS